MSSEDNGSTPPAPETDASHRLTVKPIGSDADSYPVGRNDARVGPDAMQRLTDGPSNVVELIGTKTTVAEVLRTDRADWDTETIRLDEFTRENAGVDLNESVEVRPATVNDAASLVVRSSTDRPISLNAETRAWVSERLHRWHLVEGDTVPVLDRESSPGSFTHSGALRVVATDPNGPVRVTSETSIEFQDEPEA